MKKLLVILLAFGLVVTGLCYQAVQAVEDEEINSIQTENNETALLMVLEEDKTAVSVNEYDEDDGDDDDDGDEDDEDESEGEEE